MADEQKPQDGNGGSLAKAQAAEAAASKLDDEAAGLRQQAAEILMHADAQEKQATEGGGGQAEVGSQTNGARDAVEPGVGKTVGGKEKPQAKGGSVGGGGGYVGGAPVKHGQNASRPVVGAGQQKGAGQSEDVGQQAAVMPKSPEGPHAQSGAQQEYQPPAGELHRRGPDAAHGGSLVEGDEVVTKKEADMRKSADEYWGADTSEQEAEKYGLGDKWRELQKRRQEEMAQNNQTEEQWKQGKEAEMKQRAGDALRAREEFEASKAGVKSGGGVGSQPASIVGKQQMSQPPGASSEAGGVGKGMIKPGGAQGIKPGEKAGATSVPGTTPGSGAAAGGVAGGAADGVAGTAAKPAAAGLAGKAPGAGGAAAGEDVKEVAKKQIKKQIGKMIFRVFLACLPYILIGTVIVLIILSVIFMIVGTPDVITGERSYATNTSVAMVASEKPKLNQQAVQASRQAYEKAVVAGEASEVATLAALRAAAGGDADEITATAVAGIVTAREARGGAGAAARAPISPAERDKIVAQTVAAARSAGLAVDQKRVEQLLADQKNQDRDQLLRATGNKLADFGDKENLILPQGNLSGLQTEEDAQGKRVIVLSDAAAMAYYLTAPVSGKGEVSLLYRTEQLDKSQEIGSWEIDDQVQPLMATAGADGQVTSQTFNLVEGNNKVIIKSTAGGPAITIESIILSPMAKTAGADIVASILAANTLSAQDVPFAVADKSDVTEIALRTQATDQSDRFFVITDASGIPSASDDYTLEFRWADEAKWQPWDVFSNKTRYFPVSFSVQREHTFYGNLFPSDDAAYFLAVYSREDGHEARAYFRVRATPSRHAVKLSNEVEFSLVPKS